MNKPFKAFRFLDWKVYKDAQQIFFEAHKIVNRLPKEYRFEIGTQIIRSSLSVVLNMAEGSGKSYKKDTARFLDIALGSLYETRAAFDTIQSDPAISIQIPEKLISDMDEVRKQLGGFKKSLISAEK